MTNEQLVASAEDRAAQLKQEYINFLSPIAIKNSESGIPPTTSELLKCHQLGNEYFNYLETFVGRSGLLGAHANGLWVTGFAETCHSALTAYLEHQKFLRSHIQEKVPSPFIAPDSFALANMQRMVREYLPKESTDSLAKRFKDSNLPSQGFLVQAHPNTSRIPTWQLITSAAIGLIIIGGVVALSVVISQPTPWQELVFRGCLALGLASLAAIVPGLINLNARIKSWGNYLKITAGGAIAIFVVIWAINPPQVSAPTEREPAREQ